jgi:large subunit ribosomal protein L29
VKAKELRDLSEAELEAKARELQDEIFNAKVRHSTGQLEDTAKLKRLRRDLARAETVMRQRRGAEA